MSEEGGEGRSGSRTRGWHGRLLGHTCRATGVDGAVLLLVVVVGGGAVGPAVYGVEVVPGHSSGGTSTRR